jgi:hypothetical protein
LNLLVRVLLIGALGGEIKPRVYREWPNWRNALPSEALCQSHQNL